MSATVVQGGMLVLLLLICAASIMTLVLLGTALKAVRRMQAETNQILAGRDVGPALHSVIQQGKEMNRLLANIDKRLEKLEALEKVQIANYGMRK
jgi:hypothetical protein